MNRKFWIPVIAAIACGALGGAIGYLLAGNDLDNAGHWQPGVRRFIAFTGTIGVFVGYAVAARLVRGKAVTRDGWTLSYRRIEPKASGYRALDTLKVKDFFAGLRELGYEPHAEGCDDFGNRRGKVDENDALAGCNVALVDRRVRGWVRVQLPVPAEGAARGMGLIEIWNEGGESSHELGLFAMRVLSTLVDGVTAARESSRTSQDPVAMVTAGLGDRPVHRT